MGMSLTVNIAPRMAKLLIINYIFHKNNYKFKISNFQINFELIALITINEIRITGHELSE